MRGIISRGSFIFGFSLHRASNETLLFFSALLQVNANGSVMSSDIVGSIKLKTMLSGMPELRLGLNDRVLFALTGRKCAPPSPRPPACLPLLTVVLCLGDKGKTVMMEDVKFHQCVRLSRFESDRTISFIPPDGESELMSYRINTHVSIQVEVVRLDFLTTNLHPSPPPPSGETTDLDRVNHRKVLSQSSGNHG